MTQSSPTGRMMNETLKVLWALFAVVIFIAGPVATAHARGWDLFAGAVVSVGAGWVAAFFVTCLIASRS